jgi:protein tyrosine phosphatase
MAVADKDDLNILFVKINRKGKFIAVQSRYTWVTDQFMYYTSKNQGDWIIVDFDHFFNHNKDLLKLYSTPNSQNTDTKS